MSTTSREPQDVPFHVEHPRLSASKPCSRCGRPRGQGYSSSCRECRAEYMRTSRPKYSELTPEARTRSNCRSQTNQLIRRGELEPQPCEDCGALKVQPHHDNYDDPRQVRWKCKACHRKHHRAERPAGCGHCGGPSDRPGQSFCRACHAAYSREWRKRQAEKRRALAEELATLRQTVREVQA